MIGGDVIPNAPHPDSGSRDFDTLGAQVFGQEAEGAESLKNIPVRTHKRRIITSRDIGKHEMGLAQRVIFTYADAMEIGDRIRRHREAKGLNQTELGEAVGVKQNTVSKWETGLSTPTREQVRKISNVLAVDIALLELGDDTTEAHKVRLMGFIGAGQAIEPLPGGDPLEFVDAPPGAPDGAYAAIVRGGSMYPLLRDGFMLVWWRLTPDPTPHLGEICYVELDDGRMLVKIVEPGSRRGRYTLISLQQGYEPMRDCKLKNVAPVEIIYRRQLPM